MVRKYRSAVYQAVHSYGPQVSGPQFTHPRVRRSAGPQCHFVLIRCNLA